MKLMKEFSACLFVGLILVFAAATAHAKKPDEPGGGHDGGGKGGGAVPLGVIFRDYQYDPNNGSVPGDNFGSDGSPYIDGAESVSTQIDKFRFGLNVGLNGTRNFFLDLSDCQSAPNCELPTTYLRGWNVFATSPDGAQYLMMSANGAEDDDFQKVNFQLDFFDDQDQLWRIQFNPSECPGVSADDMVTVTKISDDPDTWEFEATNQRACLHFQEGPRKNHSFNGLYIVPFRITAVALEQP